MEMTDALTVFSPSIETTPVPNYFARYFELRREIESLPLPRSIPELLKSAADRFGDAEAISFFEDGQSLTFRELQRQTRKLAHGLRSIGVSKGSHVAVLLSNRIEFVVTWLAIAELGAVVVPLITSYTPRELEFALKDADVSHLLIEGKFLSTLQDINAGEKQLTDQHVVIIGESAQLHSFHEFSALLEGGHENFSVDPVPGPDDLFSIQYTSGTTGMPKGVMLTQLFWMQCGCAFPLIWKDFHLKTVLSDHPFYYIDPQWMLIMGLWTGGPVSFTRGMSVKRYAQWVKQRHFDLAWFPSPLLQTPESPADRDVSAKLFLTYGATAEETLTAERRFRTPMREAYGMTEIGAGLIVPPEVDDPNILGTCGLPAPWRTYRIVGSDGKDVTPGQPGELWVKGPGICQGYYKRPEANAETFVDGWFRTGDVFVQEPQGYYRIIGRMKDMIKRSGENIAAAEVEQVLYGLRGVKEAAVIAVPDPQRDEEIKAYLLLAEGVTKETLAPDMVLAHCSANLARFKVPRYIAYVSEFPCTASGKIAKRLLKESQSDLRADAYDAIDKVWR